MTANPATLATLTEPRNIRVMRMAMATPRTARIKKRMNGCTLSCLR